jgi:hypothetical protein
MAAKTYSIGPGVDKSVARKNRSMAAVAALIGSAQIALPLKKEVVELYFRQQVEVNTDPQRRCYDGANYSSAMVWTEWVLIGPYSREDAESSMKTFQDINPDREYKIIPLPEES